MERLTATFAPLRFAITAAVFIILTPLAQGSSDIQSFRSHAAVLPTSMIGYGYERIGDLNARELLGRVDQMDVQFVSQIRRMGKGFEVDALRDSAQWNRGQLSIALDQRLWSRTKTKIKSVLAFHEVLGVLGYTDRIYACSGSIWLLTDPEARAHLSRAELSQVEQMASANCRSAGGSTGVTGGGDEFSIAAKIGVLESHLRRLQSTDDSQARQGTIAAMQGALTGSEVNLLRGGRFKKPSVRLTGIPHIFKGKPVLSSIVVTQDGVRILEDPKNGWTFDSETNALWFHGRSASRFQSRHVEADLETEY